MKFVSLLDNSDNFKSDSSEAERKKEDRRLSVAPRHEIS